jgi:drug/metabolite transporter (DMT)-like permease
VLLVGPGLATIRANCQVFLLAGFGMLLLQPSLAFIWDVLFFHRPTDAVDVGGAALAVGAICLGTARRAGGRAGR